MSLVSERGVSSGHSPARNGIAAVGRWLAAQWPKAVIAAGLILTVVWSVWLVWLGAAFLGLV